MRYIRRWCLSSLYSGHIALSTQHLSLGKSEKKKLSEVLQAVLNAGLC